METRWSSSSLVTKSLKEPLLIVLVITKKVLFGRCFLFSQWKSTKLSLNDGHAIGNGEKLHHSDIGDERRVWRERNDYHVEHHQHVIGCSASDATNARLATSRELESGKFADDDSAFWLLRNFRN